MRRLASESVWPLSSVTPTRLDTDPATSASAPGQGSESETLRHCASHFRASKSNTTAGAGDVAVGVGSDVAVEVGVAVAVDVGEAVGVGVDVAGLVAVGVDVGESCTQVNVTSAFPACS